jgi:SAM-dependent methyltransferase
MSATAPDVNYWHDRRCARAFWAQRELRPYRQLLADTRAWLDPAPGERWLDLGCGSGQLTRALWEESGGRLHAVVAADCAAANEHAVAAACAKLQPSPPPGAVRFCHLDFSHGLPGFASASLDGVVSGLAIQYAQHYDEAEGRWTTRAYDHLLAEVRRVLRPGGKFIFSVNVPDPDWNRVGLLGVPAFFRSGRPLAFFRNSMRMLRYGKWLKAEAARGRFHYLPRGAVFAKLARAGFVAVDHRLSYASQAFLFRAFCPSGPVS